VCSYSRYLPRTDPESGSAHSEYCTAIFAKMYRYFIKCQEVGCCNISRTRAVKVSLDIIYFDSSIFKVRIRNKTRELLEGHRCDNCWRDKDLPKVRPYVNFTLISFCDNFLKMRIKVPPHPPLGRGFLVCKIADLLVVTYLLNLRTKG
jgi:hypothetical protein